MSRRAPTWLACVLAVVLWHPPLYAYLDPGSGGLLMQILLGGFAGAAVMLRLVWMRFRDRLPFGRTEPRPPDRDA